MHFPVKVAAYCAISDGTQITTSRELSPPWQHVDPINKYVYIYIYVHFHVYHVQSSQAVAHFLQLTVHFKREACIDLPLV